jgi:hypothetical protein
MNNRWKDPRIIVKVCGVVMIACPLVLLMFGDYWGASVFAMLYVGVFHLS